MPIQLLSSEVVNQIAAGEVVERPAHLVKELVENSIDAGATQIEIDFAQGGRYVRVTDNGRGIDREELPLALERFATSKIAEAQDLWRLSSFGFRGEALASISSVSRLTLHSNFDEQGGYQIISDFGVLSSVAQVARTKGTTVIVEELFANVPARLKFLKSEAGEHSQIKVVLKTIALAHPHVEFRISQKSELVYFFAKTEDFMKRIQDVLEIESLYQGQAQRNRVKASAFFADPNTTAKTSRSMYLFAQGRPIQDRSLNAAIMEAYRNLVMHGEFPIAVVFLETEPEEIDVNIHPTKSQVKFAYPQDAFRATQAAIREVLEKAPWTQKIVTTQFVAPSPEGSSLQSVGDQSKIFQTEALREPVFNLAPIEAMRFQDPIFDKTMTRQKDLVSFQTKSGFVSRPQEPTLKLSDFEMIGEKKVHSHWEQLEVLGQAHLTYIVGQTATGILFIDQHAAHERVNFEKLMLAWKGGKIDVQNFLFPLAIDLSEEKIEALKSKEVDLKKIGIEFEELGPATIGVRCAPLILKDQAVATELSRLADEIVDKSESFLMERVIGDIFARLACHSSVRAGQALSKDEMKSLLKQMDEFPLSTFCPHGRPVYVDYPFYKLEKDFGRIV